MKREYLSSNFILIIGISLSLFGCATTKPPVVRIEPGEDYGCKRPSHVDPLILNKHEFELAALNIGKFALGKTYYKNDLQLVEIMTKAAGDLLVVEYLVCVAMNRGDVNKNDPKQVNWLRNKLYFMQSKPTPEQIIEWDKENPPDFSAPETPKAPQTLRSGGSRSLVPGLGQFHKEQHKKGWIFIGAEAILFSTASISLVCSNLAHNDALDATTQAERDYYNDLSSDWRAISNFSWVLLGITHVVNMIDGFSRVEISSPSNSNSDLRSSYLLLGNRNTFLITFRLDF